MMLKKLYGIQVLRGIASIFILLAHASMYVKSDYFRVFKPGTSAVTFFFILSGFMIFCADHKSIGQPSNFKSYLLKRLTRIYPTYWVYTTIFLLISYYFLYTDGHHLIITNHLTFIDVVKSFLLFPYNLKEANWPIIPPAWTLSYELLFYFSFGLLMFRNKLCRCVISTWLLIIVLIVITGYQPTGLFVKFFFYPGILLFIIGSALAYTFLKYSDLKFGKQMMMLGILYLAVSWSFSYFNAFESRFRSLLTYGVSYSLIILGTVLAEQSNTVFQKNRIIKIAAYLGDASYSIYLTHYWILALLFNFSNKLDITKNVGEPIVFASVSFFTLLLGIGAYTFIEKPLHLKLKNTRIKVSTERLQF